MTDTPPAGAARVERASAARTRDRDWQVLVPSAFLLLVVAALVALPFMDATHVRSTREYTQPVAEPARAAETAVLVPLVPRLGGAVGARFAEMERAQEAWHRLVERGLRAAPGTPARARAHLEGGAYEDVLLAAARLDEAIAAEMDRDQRRIIDAERTHRRLSASLALLGLAGAGVVVWLARRLRRSSRSSPACRCTPSGRASDSGSPSRAASPGCSAATSRCRTHARAPARASPRGCPRPPRGDRRAAESAHVRA